MIEYETKHACETLSKMADDEPIFVIRAQDASAPAIIQLWLSQNPQISAEKKEKALIQLAAMRAWQGKKKAD